ncbi:MAG: hypothetical protein LBR16_01375 [Treponema sp.]|jgi:hypothetical protein|nr:hypothetical protein [Treponema sp.]
MMKKRLALLLALTLILNSCTSLTPADKKRNERIAGLAGLLVTNGILMAFANQNQYLEPDTNAKIAFAFLGVSFAVSIVGGAIWIWRSDVSAHISE